LKKKIEKKNEKKISQHNDNSGNYLGEINPINNNVSNISSIKDCAQRIDNLFNKYGNYFSNEDVNEYKAIVQYLNNFS
jgi:hypothetical protein